MVVTIFNGALGCPRQFSSNPEMYTEGKEAGQQGRALGIHLLIMCPVTQMGNGIAC